MSTPSCNSKEPLIRLDDDGKASILNYNLPQATCIGVLNYAQLNLPFSTFKANYNTEPSNHFWRSASQFDVNGVKDNLSFDKSLIINSGREGANGRIIKNSVSSVLPYTDEYLARKIAEGHMPVVYKRFGGTKEVVFVKKPINPAPKLYIVLHLKTCSYLGDYGAGQTIKTFSLLPGEKNTITIRHYLRDEATKKRSEHILDSISESSVEDLQNTVEVLSSGKSLTAENTSAGHVDTWEVSGGLNLSFIVEGVPIGVNLNGSLSGANTDSRSLNETIEQQVTNLNRAVDSHVSKADSQRQIDVNNESSSTNISEVEETTVREVENINKSRVLNFVFRQLLQEYFSITYLDDVSFYFTNGYPESTKKANLSGLDALLNDIMQTPQQVANLKTQILAYLSSIYDYEGTRRGFIECVEEKIGLDLDCPCVPPMAEQTLCYIRKKKNLLQTYKDKTVNGIILSVSHRIVRTPSLIVDALLGQGEALDCYNQKLQDAATLSAELQNTKLEQALRVIEGIEDPIERARLYKKVFSECCEVPQSACGCSGSVNMDK